MGWGKPRCKQQANLTVIHDETQRTRDFSSSFDYRVMLCSNTYRELKDNAEATEAPQCLPSGTSHYEHALEPSIEMWSLWSVKGG